MRILYMGLVFIFLIFDWFKSSMRTVRDDQLPSRHLGNNDIVRTNGWWLAGVLLLAYNSKC